MKSIVVLRRKVRLSGYINYYETNGPGFQSYAVRFFDDKGLSYHVKKDLMGVSVIKHEGNALEVFGVVEYKMGIPELRIDSFLIKEAKEVCPVIREKYLKKVV